MADKEQLDILTQSVDDWNEWRRKHKLLIPNFDGASLIGANLYCANLRNTSLIGVNLSGADLEGADFSNSILTGSSLGGANLRDSDFIGAALRGVMFIGANLCRANFRGADLSGADFDSADLSSADFTNAIVYNAKMGYTILGDLDLSLVNGLHTVRHIGPSTIGIDTIYRSQGKIPEIFLRHAGVPDNFIEYMHSLVDEAFQFYTCFISYSSKDEDFAERLYKDLQGAGVRCWYAPHDLPIGKPIIRGLDEAIRVHDKTLLVLSAHSVKSRWVEQEVEMAYAKEIQGDNPMTVLFPIRLDNAVMETDVTWADTIRRTRNIGDFTKWKDYDAYQKSFKHLISDLKSGD